jgi:hypothetical protein
MPGTFTYDAGTNTVTVTGGTSGSPATFGDFVAADRAGTLNSQDARDITGVDGSPVAVTRAIRPVERLVLGGPAHTLYLVITNWNAASATIRIEGTDYDGNGQQEDIAISGNGTLYAVNRYKAITSTQVTALSGTGFTYTLTQAGWGVIWGKGSGQYEINAIVMIGDGSTSTYFQDKDKQIVLDSLSANWTWYWDTKTNATCILGQLEDESYKITSHGCQIILASNYNGYFRATYLYSCSFFLTGRSFYHYVSRQWNCHYMGKSLSETIRPNPAYWNNVVASFVTLYPESGSYSHDFVVSESALYSVANATFRDATFIGSSLDPTNRAVITFININLVNTTVSLNSYWGATINLLASINIHLTDKDGNAIEGATVNLYDKDGNPVWVEDSVTTGVDGKIIEKTAQYGRYYALGTVDGGDGVTYLESNTPHTLTITKDGYQDYQDIITIDRKMDLEVALLQTVAGSGGGVSPTNLGLLPLGIKQVAI